MRELGLDTAIFREQVPIDVRTGAIFADEPEKAQFYRERLHPDSRMPVLATDGDDELCEGLLPTNLDANLSSSERDVVKAKTYLWGDEEKRGRTG